MSPDSLYSKGVRTSARRQFSSSLDDLDMLSPIGSADVPTRLNNNAYQDPMLQATPQQKGTSELAQAMPKLNVYEPADEADSSVVIANPASDLIHHTAATDQQATSSPGPAYDMVHSVEPSEQQDLAERDPAMYKHLVGHDDTNNVQLVSMRATSHIQSGSPVVFPHGGSHSMNPIHYAAASGDKKALNEIVSALPFSQGSVEMVLGSGRMCQREGVDLPRDSEGRTALIHSVHGGHADCVKLLVEAGADLNAVTNGQ